MLFCYETSIFNPSLSILWLTGQFLFIVLFENLFHCLSHFFPASKFKQLKQVWGRNWRDDSAGDVPSFCLPSAVLLVGSHTYSCFPLGPGDMCSILVQQLFYSLSHLPSIQNPHIFNCIFIVFFFLLPLAFL